MPTVQYTHGMLSCCEFTGVPLRWLLDDCGADFKKAKFVLAEGADGSSMTRTINMANVLDDVMVAYGMNGEMLRRRTATRCAWWCPACRGVSWVKYLRRIEVGDQPHATKDESIHYVDLMPDGQHRQYTSIQEVKSVITSPSGGQVLIDKGFFNITGIAWSGRGKIRKGRCLGGWRQELENRASGNTDPRQMPDPLQPGLDLGRWRCGADVTCHRFHRTRAAFDHRAAQGAWYQVDLSSTTRFKAGSSRPTGGQQCSDRLTGSRSVAVS